jgi:ribosomal protein S27E
MAELRTVYPEITPMGLVVVCKDCGKQSCRYAVKCAQCKEVFVYNPRASHPEKCPKCGFEPVKNE